MTAPVITSESTASTITGVVDRRFGQVVWHFRGITYGHIPKRFASPEYVALREGEVDATRFGPQCPQPRVDVGHLLRIPPDVPISPHIAEDEFGCLNLNITCPPRTNSSDVTLLPVLVWVHGGSQCVTFASAASPVCDPTHLVAHAAGINKPLIVVTFNYRLNIFAFGDGTGQCNLALRDQRVALEWVSKNIASFGGDANRITLAGESAGAVYVHAHLLNKNRVPVQRAILSSGSLHLSPPQPHGVGERLISRLVDELASRGDTLQNATAESLVQALVNCGIVSMWLQQEPGLDEWDIRTERVDALMVSDVEYESIIWRNGVEGMATEQIISTIRNGKDEPTEIEKLYHIYPGRPTSSRNGVLDFMNDTRFALPALEICERWRQAGRQDIFQYIVDEPNPWQVSSRAHHAVDLILLFGGIDLSFNPGAAKVGSKMRETWAEFVRGGRPWESSMVQAFGPHGRCEELTLQEYAGRRRAGHFEHLKELGASQCRALSGSLGMGRLSLLN
ncbi:Carboxylic ester hydrolase [Pleurostoma richardsiae]|uniref:Carboxylic ester hydrolase n=1 Tax=Pleurostoma richardsiae TaxID=41990 RepID=A0AA38VII5_9PEZI|nr:Carboxylic ester hydrolase [Pleurostoma richardsiae]